MDDSGDDLIYKFTDQSYKFKKLNWIVTWNNLKVYIVVFFLSLSRIRIMTWSLLELLLKKLLKQMNS